MAKPPIDPGEFRIEKAEIHLASGQVVKLADPKTGFLTLVFTEDMKKLQYRVN